MKCLVTVTQVEALGELELGIERRLSSWWAALDSVGRARAGGFIYDCVICFCTSCDDVQWSVVILHTIYSIP